MPEVKDKEYKLATAKLFDLNEGKMHVIALSSEEIFGAADTVLVSEDKVTWIAHNTDDFMDAVNNEKPIRVR